MIFFKEHIKKNAGYNEVLEANEDHELYLRLMNISHFIFIKEILYFLRLRENSLSNKPVVTYVIQTNYFLELKKNLDNMSIFEENKLLGWREFYYGNRNLARRIWRKINFQKWDIKISLAFLISYLPKIEIDKLIINKTYFRIKYLFNRLVKFRKLQSEFKKIIHKTNLES